MGAKPSIGTVGKIEEVKEEQIIMQCERRLTGKVVTAIKKAHPYEEVPIFVHRIERLR